LQERAHHASAQRIGHARGNEVVEKLWDSVHCLTMTLLTGLFQQMDHYITRRFPFRDSRYNPRFLQS